MKRWIGWALLGATGVAHAGTYTVGDITVGARLNVFTWAMAHGKVACPKQDPALPARCELVDGKAELFDVPARVSFSTMSESDRTVTSLVFIADGKDYETLETRIGRDFGKPWLYRSVDRANGKPPYCTRWFDKSRGVAASICQVENDTRTLVEFSTAN